MRGVGLLKSAILSAVLLCIASNKIQAQGATIKAAFEADKTISTTDASVLSFQNKSTGATGYRWITGDGTVLNNNGNLVWEYSDLGNYKVGLVAYNQAEADTSYVNITVLRGANLGNPLGYPQQENLTPAVSIVEEK